MKVINWTHLKGMNGPRQTKNTTNKDLVEKWIPSAIQRIIGPNVTSQIYYCNFDDDVSRKNFLHFSKHFPEPGRNFPWDFALN